MPSDDGARDGARRGSGRTDANGNCVEVDSVVDGRIGVRSSKNPGAGVVFFTRAEMNAWIQGVKSRTHDDASRSASEDDSARQLGG